MYYGSTSILLGGAAQAVIASQTKKPVSKAVKVLGGGATHLAVDVSVVPAAAVTNGINIIVQDSQDGGTTWNDKKTTAVADTFTGWKSQTYLVEVAGDQQYCPIRGLVRVVVTTGVGDTITIADVIITQGA